MLFLFYSENCHGDEVQASEDMVGANGDGDHFIADAHYAQHQKTLPRYAEQQQVYIRHEDPHTGEASYLLDMDASKRSHSNHDSPFQSHSQDVKVLATGYSDAVPPNTTVLIYTTNNEGAQQVTIGEAGAEHVIVEDPNFMRASHVEYRGKENRQEVNSEKIVGAASNPSSEQIVRREAIGTRQMHNNSGVTQAVYKTVGEAQTVTKESASPLQQPFSYVLSPASKSLSTNTFGSGSCSPSFSKTSSAIPDIRRIFIPNKRMAETSPWEVGGAEDAEAYSMCAESMHYEAHRESPHTDMKEELTDASSPSRPTRQEHNYKVEEENEQKPPTVSQPQDHVEKSSMKSPKSMGLNSYLEGAVANNLRTFEVSQIADSFVSTLDQVDADNEEPSS